MYRLSPTGWFFVVVLALVVGITIIAHFSPHREFWAPVMKVVAYFVGAGILVNLYRYWRASPNDE